MRVGLVVPYDLAEEGGVKRHAFHLADALRRGGDEVEILGPLSRGAPPAHVRGFGGVVNVPANGSANHMALFVAPWAVARHLAARRFDVLHLHEPMVPMLSYWALAFSPGAARVATFHMYAEAEPRASRLARAALARLLHPALDAAIAVSPAAAEFAAPLWRRPLPVIPNGVPTSVYVPDAHAAVHAHGRDALGRTHVPGAARGHAHVHGAAAGGVAVLDPPAADGALRLLFVGNWRDRRKGLPVLLEAHRLLRARGVAATLDVIGQGEPDAAMRATPGVTFHGTVSSEHDLARHYRSCDVFVAPATGQESFGIVLLEAMACGRAVVCSDIRGYRDVIDPAGARLVPPGDAPALARALTALAAAPAERRAMGARNRPVAERYDWARIAVRVRGVYEQAVAARARGRG